MDFIDEQHLLVPHIGQYCRQVAFDLQRWA